MERLKSSINFFPWQMIFLPTVVDSTFLIGISTGILVRLIELLVYLGGTTNKSANRKLTVALNLRIAAFREKIPVESTLFSTYPHL